MNLQFLKEMPDRELLLRVQRLAQSERQATAVLVAHLAEIECRKLYLEQSCRSLFTYCTQVLHLSEHAAYNRIEAARIARRFPAVLTPLAAGDVHLTALRLLGPLLTAENHCELLEAAKHKSRREVEELIVRLRPQPDVQTMVRKLPGGKGAASGAQRDVTPGVIPGAIGVTPGVTEARDRERVTSSLFEATRLAPAACSANPPAGTPAVLSGQAASPAGSDVGPARARGAVRQAATVVPLAPERYKVQFTASAATHAKLRQAQELLRHRIPDGDVAAVIDAALDLLVGDLEKKKFAATARPAGTARGPQAAKVAAPVSPVSPVSPALSRRAQGGGMGAPRYIPAAVKRAVWQRDGGRCAFVGSNGIRCNERGQLEFDHIHPHADGGPAAVANVRLLCRQHNQYEARLFFGVWQADGTEPPQRQASQT